MGTCLNVLSSKLSVSSSARVITYLSCPSTPILPGLFISKPQWDAIASMWAKTTKIRFVFSKWLLFGNTKAWLHFHPLPRLQTDQQAWSYSEKSGDSRIRSIKNNICPKICLKVTYFRYTLYTMTFSKEHLLWWTSVMSSLPERLYK